MSEDFHCYRFGFTPIVPSTSHPSLGLLMSSKHQHFTVFLSKARMEPANTIFRRSANPKISHRSWQANKLNEQSELKRAFQLALVLADSEPHINVTVSIKGRLRQGWRRYTFGYSKDPPRRVQIELRPQASELASTIDTLAAEIARLNTLPVPEYTMPAGNAQVDNAQTDHAPAGDSAENGDTLGLPQQQVDIPTS